MMAGETLPHLPHLTARHCASYIQKQQPWLTGLVPVPVLVAFISDEEESSADSDALRMFGLRKGKPRLPGDSGDVSCEP